MCQAASATAGRCPARLPPTTQEPHSHRPTSGQRQARATPDRIRLLGSATKSQTGPKDPRALRGSKSPFGTSGGDAWTRTSWTTSRRGASSTPIRLPRCLLRTCGCSSFPCETTWTLSACIRSAGCSQCIARSRSCPHCTSAVSHVSHISPSTSHGAAWARDGVAARQLNDIPSSRGNDHTPGASWSGPLQGQRRCGRFGLRPFPDRTSRFRTWLLG